jgi:predicted Zn finger-like uncharacterized protein
VNVGCVSGFDIWILNFSRGINMAQPLTFKDVSHKLRTLKPKPPGKETVSTNAYPTTRVTALENGINLNRQDGGLIEYPDISLLVAFQLDTDPDTWYGDLFVYGQSGSFRLSQKAINYRQFLPEIAQRSKDNFYAFLLYLINRTDSIYVDERTLEFLKLQKMPSFPDFKLVEEYTKQLWFQIISWMKFQCDQCHEVYWVDDAKVSAQGAKTKCVKCQHIITVKKRERPVPLKPKEAQKKIPCPYCQYENPEGNQFCVMCQKPLVVFTPPPKPPLPKPPSEETRVQESDVFEDTGSAPDILSLPLQARGRRKPRLSFREIAMSLQDDIKTMENKFSLFSKFSLIIQILGYIFLAGGVLTGVYLRFVLGDPKPPNIPLTLGQRWAYAGISAVIGGLLFFACIVVSNIIALTLQIEQNTKITTLLLQKLVEKEEE